MDKVKEREYDIAKNYRHSTMKLLNDPHAEILKVLNKNQAEKFNRMTASIKARGTSPPPICHEAGNLFNNPECGKPPLPPHDACGPGSSAGPCGPLLNNSPEYDDEDLLRDLSVVEMLLEQDDRMPPDSTYAR